MAKPRTLAAPTATAVDAAARAGTQDLVGWAVESPLRAGGRLSAPMARQALATALGITAESLESLDGATLQRALGRLRRLAVYTDELAAQAATDDLTGALRRGIGLAALQREIDRAHRGGRGLVVAFMDVDGLKHLNDTVGHAAGDELLRNVVAAIGERVRSYDLVFRYGGDEFVCVLVDTTLEQAERTAGDIRVLVERRTEGHTVSVGLAALGHDDDAVRIVARADTALYRQRRHHAPSGSVPDDMPRRRRGDQLVR
jgi:diguanylate cyclase (GGDEF)-like protein